MNRRSIGILVTNTDRSEFARRNPHDSEKFTALMRAVRPAWDYPVFDCTRGEFPPDVAACDGYIIGGSPASVNDPDAWIATLLGFIRQLDAARRPTVGCCFGHQAMAKALGGTVGKNPGGWGFGVAATHFSAAEPWMQPAAGTLHLFAAHSEQVTQLPAGARAIGGDAFCPVASFMVGQHFLTTEYHPEMTLEFFLGLTHAFEAYIGTAVAARARSEAATRAADGPRFAEWMARFLAA